MTGHDAQTYVGIPRNEIAWSPTIDFERCDGCGDCVRHCKHDVFAVVDGKPVVAKPENCVVGCKASDGFALLEPLRTPQKRNLEKC